MIIYHFLDWAQKKTIWRILSCCYKINRNWLPMQGVKKQGSSENDGRSDVYDHLEFKIVSNCCYLNCSRTNCGHFVNLGNLPKHTWIYLNFFLNLPEFTRLYLNLPELIGICMNLPNMAWNYMKLLEITWKYLKLPRLT